MTYVSFWLEAIPKGTDRRPIIYDLPNVGGKRFGPYDLQAWARREVLDIEYVDNCFLRVRVTREKLICLLSELYGSQDLLPEAMSPGASDCEYTLVAEEF